MNYDWKQIQAKLKTLGFYSGKIDGLRGPLTDQAIVAFKKSVGFVARAYYGPLTHEALMGQADKAPVQEGPPWYLEALRMKGLHERADNSTLKTWFDKSVAWIDPREIPWCGAFVATCQRKAIPNTDLPVNPLGARQWGAYGVEASPCLGSILTFWRGSPSGWQGHVAYYVGEDPTHYHVLGGNQSNAVNIMRIARNRLLQSRWPKGVAVTTNPVLLSPSGVPVSINEA